MIRRIVEELYGDARTASQARWVLAGVAVGAAVLAAAVAGVGRPMVLGAILIFVLAAIAQPAGNAGIVVMIIVLARWLATGDGPPAANALALAGCLFAFHLALALMAATPNSADIEPSVRRRWIVRGGITMLATAGVWALVAVFDRRDADGSPVLAFGALFTVAVGAALVRSRAVEDRPGRLEPRAGSSARR